MKMGFIVWRFHGSIKGKTTDDTALLDIDIVLNWFEELKERVPLP